MLMLGDAQLLLLSLLDPVYKWDLVTAFNCPCLTIMGEVQLQVMSMSLPVKHDTVSYEIISYL